MRFLEILLSVFFGKTVIVAFRDPIKAALKERQYMANHPCRCGGQWQRVNGGSAYPHVFSICVCNSCGNQRRFDFRII